VDSQPREPHDYRRAIAALDAKGAAGACPICKNNSWAPPGELGNLVVGLQLLTPGPDHVALGDEQGHSGGIVCYALVCDRCGYVRLHDADTLESGEKP